MLKMVPFVGDYSSLIVKVRLNGIHHHEGDVIFPKGHRPEGMYVQKCKFKPKFSHDRSLPHILAD